MPRRRSAAVLRSCLLLLAAPRLALALTPDDLPQLMALDDRAAATMAAPTLSWSADGAYLAAGGAGPGGISVVMLIPVDGRPPLPLPALVSPHLAFSPVGSQIAGWVRGPGAPGGGETARLALLDPHSTVATPLEGVAPFAAPSPIVWLAEPPRIIALRNHQGYAALVIFDPTTGQPAPVAPTVLGLGVALRCAATPGAVIVGAVGADGRREESLVDVRSGVITLAPPGEASPSAPGGGAPSPEGTLVASCRQDGLWVGTPQEPWARRLLPRGEAPGHQFLAASTPLWSPTGEYLAYLLKPLGRADQEIHIVTLGLEEILCRLGYEAGATPPALGATVWVCTALRLDALGVPYEPEWKTLKAQLQVTSSPATEGTALVVRARNVGLAGGVLKRLTGLAEPPPGAENSSSLKIKPAGGAQQTLVQSFDVPPRAGLLAWSKGASTGRVIGVTVTRRALLLIGAPAGP